MSKQVENQEKKDKETPDNKVLDQQKKINSPDEIIKDQANEIQKLKTELEVSRKELEDTNRQLTLKTKQLVTFIDAMDEMSGNLTVTGGQLTSMARTLKIQNQEAYNAYILDKARAKPQIQEQPM